MRKYEFTGETQTWDGRTLHRIRALRDFGEVKAGDLGGWLESEGNLSHRGTCWVADEARVADHARVSGDAQVYGYAHVYEQSEVYERARVYDHAVVRGYAVVCGNALVSGHAVVRGDAEVTGDALIERTSDHLCISPNGSQDGGIFTAYRSQNGGIECSRGFFSGTLEEFEQAVRRTHGDSKYAKVYEVVVALSRAQLERTS
jgi:hypothetical protein